MTDHEKDKLINDLQTEIATMKTIISMMPGHVYWKDVDGNYLGCNSNLANVLKLYSPDDIIGKTDFDLIGETIGNAISQIDKEVLAGEREKRIEEEGFDADGNPASYLTQKSPLFNKQGKIIGLLGMSLDITLRRQAEAKLVIEKEKAEHANRIKSEFLAMISHELRTPLTSILGFVNFLQQNNLSENDKKEYIQHIINSGSYLFSLINNLLDYNKLENNKFQLTNAAFDLQPVCIDVINMLSGAAKHKGLYLFVDYPKNISHQFIGDSRVIQQILMNLVGNAIKFTEKGHVAIRIQLLDTTHEFTSFKISVEDTGIGIAPDEIKHIFKSFHQVEHVYKRSASLTGTGLGLTIAKRLAKLINTRIEVQSELDIGTTFYFSVSFPNAPTEKNAIKAAYDFKPHILLVEDDALIQIVHKQMLEDLGCQVTIAECAHKAIELLAEPFSLVFIDLGLPDINGFELIKIIRQNEQLQALPLIALTGYSEDNILEECIRIGANQVAVKPISKMELEKILIEFIV